MSATKGDRKSFDLAVIVSIVTDGERNINPQRPITFADYNAVNAHVFPSSGEHMPGIDSIFCVTSVAFTKTNAEIMRQHPGLKSVGFLSVAELREEFGNEITLTSTGL